MTPVEKAIAWFGSRAEMARAFGVSRVAVTLWAQSGALPPQRAIEMEKITGGEMKAVDLVRKA